MTALNVIFKPASTLAVLGIIHKSAITLAVLFVVCHLAIASVKESTMTLYLEDKDPNGYRTIHDFQSAYDMLEKRQTGGWMTKIECEWLYNQAQKSKRILEIGVFKGRSTFMLCCGTEGTVFAVDHFIGPFADGHGGEMSTAKGRQQVIDGVHTRLREFFKMGRLFLLESTSTQASNILSPIAKHNPFDFIFIDGAHDYENVRNDIALCLPLLAPDGLISGHDFKAEYGVPKAVINRFGKTGYQIAPGTSIWWACPKSSHVFSSP